MDEQSLPHFHVVFRTCDIIESLHKTPRPFGADKRTLLKVCFLSLLESLEGTKHTITVLGDRLRDDSIAFFRSHDAELVQGEWGNDDSLRESMRRALEQRDDTWVYLCEDDYLHEPNAFRRITDIIQHRGEYLATKTIPYESLLPHPKLSEMPLIIHPTDYPDRYLARYRRPSFLFTSKDCHWRQITDTTFTFLAEGSTFRRFEKLLMATCKGANDRMLSKKLYANRTFRGRALCLSPIPGVATHMHEGVMSPLVDWESIYHRIAEKVMI